MKNVEIKFRFGRSQKSEEGFVHKENDEDYKNSDFPGGILLKVGDNIVTGNKERGHQYFGDELLMEFIAWLGILSVVDGESLKCWRTEGPEFIMFELIDKNTVMIINYDGYVKKIENSDTVSLTRLVPEIIKSGEYLINHALNINHKLADNKDIQRFQDLLKKLKEEWKEYQKQLV